MGFVSSALSFHPFVVELIRAVVASAIGAGLSLWGGGKLYAALAGKNSRAAAIVSFLWYLLLYAYFSILFFVLPYAALLDFGVSQYELDRADFAGGNYPLAIFLIFLIGGAAAFFALMRKQSVSATLDISLPRALWSGTWKTLLAVLAAFALLVVSRVPAVHEKQLTEETVSKIHAQKLTLADVMGQNLPPEPTPTLKDATLAGVDANNNGIRDDMELAIFKLHPDSARIRAAELQYAMALQAELTPQILNSETLVAVLQEESRASLCVTDTGQKVTLSDSNETINKAFAVTDARKQEVEELVFNTNKRRTRRQEIREKYMKSYGDVVGTECDIDLISLSN